MLRAIFIFVIAIQIIFIIFAKRSVFITPYDTSYWKDRYEHSQYQLPLSKRIIGDDGLYAYAGYRLIKGDDPFSINVDKPPLGKYILGLSTILLGNPFIASLLFGVGSLVLVYLCARLMLRNQTQALVVTVLVSFDAMFFSQLWISALDIFQLFWLLLAMTTCVYWYRGKTAHSGMLFISGLTLGFFAEVKPPILIVVLIPLFVVWIMTKQKNYMAGIRSGILWGVGVVSGIVLPYMWYLRLGHSLIDIARVHRFMYEFYRATKSDVHYGAIFDVLLRGKFPDISSGVLVSVHEWSPFWVVAVIIFVWACITALKYRKKYDAVSLGILFFCASSLLIFSVIPSYPRFVLLVLPFLYIIAMQFVSRYVSRGVVIAGITLLILFGLFRTVIYLRPSVEPLSAVCLYSYTKQYFQDVYEECLDRDSKRAISAQTFTSIAAKAMREADIVRTTSRVIEQNDSAIRVEFTYDTRRLGPFTETKIIPILNQDGVLKLRWNWDLLLKDFRPGFSIKSAIQNGTRGRILNSDGHELAKDTMGYLVSVTPSLLELDREKDMMQLLSSMSGISALELQNEYLENPVDLVPVPLFTLFRPLDNKTEKALRSYRAVSLLPYPARIYLGSIGPEGLKNTAFDECCRRIYSSIYYRGISGPDFLYDTALSGHDGGTLQIVNDNGEVVRILIDKSAKSGMDVTVSL